MRYSQFSNSRYNIIRQKYSNKIIRNLKMTSASFSSSTKPKVLRLGDVAFAQKKWSELESKVEVVQGTSQSRSEFFHDLKTKYSDVTAITRTFQSGAQTGRFDEELVSHLPQSLKVISHCGAGYDQVDPEPLTDRGIQLSNVTEPVEGPTATTAVYLTLAALRNFQEGHDLLVQGKWPKGGKCAGAKLGHEPEGKVVGILGMGGIGRAIRDRLEPFGFAKYIYHNRSKLSPDLSEGVDYVSFEQLLKESDILFISVPLNKNTHHLIDGETMNKMKDGVVLINTARGPVVDESDLLEKLKSGKVGAFGSDVFEFEPELSQELADLPNVVSLPHMGTHSSEAIRNMEEWVVDNVLSHLYTGKVKSIVPDQAKIDFSHTAVLSDN